MRPNLARRRAAVIREPVRFDGTGINDVVRRVRAGSSRLSGPDQDFLTDLTRGQYRTQWLDRLVDVSARAETDEAAFAFVESLRARIAARRAQSVLPLDEAIRREDAAQYEEDLAVRKYTMSRARTDLRRVCEAVHDHAVALWTLHASAAASADRGEA